VAETGAGMKCPKKLNDIGLRRVRELELFDSFPDLLAGYAAFKPEVVEKHLPEVAHYLPKVKLKPLATSRCNYDCWRLEERRYGEPSQAPSLLVGQPGPGEVAPADGRWVAGQRPLYELRVEEVSRGTRKAHS
jgi:hypothetical protein